MFKKETYIQRRKQLREDVKSGLILLFGNNESPVNCPANAYQPFRQDATFRYFFGHNHSGLVGVIDADTGAETLVGNDVDIDDIVWLGAVDSVAQMAERVGVANTAPMRRLSTIVHEALRLKRPVHFLPPYRHDIMIQIFDLLGIHPNQQVESASLSLIQAVVRQRSVKSAEEVQLLDEVAAIGYKMHTTAMKLCYPGAVEQEIAGVLSGIASGEGSMVSFPTILTQHGEIMHGTPTRQPLQAGRLMLCDAGAESVEGYCSDNTRTTPVSGRFTQQQRDIYSIVVECHDYALQVAHPGVKWVDVHFGVCRIITERLKELGLMKGNTDDALAAGAHALFLPHGLGHMMGLDVHDMEALGQIHVGFDEEVRPRLDQFGTASLRMGRRLQEGFVVTDEPGIYFIPALIDDWQAKGHCQDFICYDKLQEYRDFGGIRIEDDLLITAEGCRFLGKERIPYHPDEVEDFMSTRH